MVIDPIQVDVVLKAQWVPYHVPDGVVPAALEPCGTLREVSRDTGWLKVSKVYSAPLG